MSGTTLPEVIDQLQELYLAEKARVRELEAENAKLRIGIMQEAHKSTSNVLVSLADCKHANNLYAYCLACKLEEVEAERDKDYCGMRDMQKKFIAADSARIAVEAERDRLRSIAERICHPDNATASAVIIRAHLAEALRKP